MPPGNIRGFVRIGVFTQDTLDLPDTIGRRKGLTGTLQVRRDAPPDRLGQGNPPLMGPGLEPAVLRYGELDLGPNHDGILIPP